MTVSAPTRSRRPVDKAELLPIARAAEERISQAGDIEELRYAFEAFYGKLGWKALCRMFVLYQTPAEALRLKD